MCFLSNRQQIDAKWQRSSCVLVPSTWQISLRGVASTSHLSPSEGKIRAQCTIEEPNQCLMHIFGCYSAPCDESHQGKRYHLKNFIEDAIFSLHFEHLQFTWKFEYCRSTVLIGHSAMKKLVRQGVLNWFWPSAISSLSAEGDESLQAFNSMSPWKMSSCALAPTPAFPKHRQQPPSMCLAPLSGSTNNSPYELYVLCGSPESRPVGYDKNTVALSTFDQRSG